MGDIYFERLTFSTCERGCSVRFQNLRTQNVLKQKRVIWQIQIGRLTCLVNPSSGESKRYFCDRIKNFFKKNYLVNTSLKNCLDASGSHNLEVYHLSGGAIAYHPINVIFFWPKCGTRLLGTHSWAGPTKRVSGSLCVKHGLQSIYEVQMEPESQTNLYFLHVMCMWKMTYRENKVFSGMLFWLDEENNIFQSGAS